MEMKQDKTVEKIIYRMWKTILKQSIGNDK